MAFLRSSFVRCIKRLYRPVWRKYSGREVKSRLSKAKVVKTSGLQIANDPSDTFGKWLRRFSLDELPQFLMFFGADEFSSSAASAARGTEVSSRA